MKEVFDLSLRFVYWIILQIEYNKHVDARELLDLEIQKTLDKKFKTRSRKDTQGIAEEDYEESFSISSANTDDQWAFYV